MRISEKIRGKKFLDFTYRILYLPEVTVEPFALIDSLQLELELLKRLINSAYINTKNEI